MDWEGTQLTLTEQAELLSLNRTSLYYEKKQVGEEELRIKHRIDEIYTKYPFYGSRKIRKQLNREGIRINRKCVQRHMREIGISAYRECKAFCVNAMMAKARNRAPLTK